MADTYNNNQNNNNTGGMPCHNRPRLLAHIAIPQRNVYLTEMKMRLLQLLYANPFIGLDHKDPYIHLTIFYAIFGTLGASETKEEAISLRLISYPLIGKSKQLYLDQSKSIMTNQNALEENCLNIFFPYEIFMEANITFSMFYQGATKILCEGWRGES